MNKIYSYFYGSVVILISTILGIVIVELLLRFFISSNSISKTDEANILRNFEYKYKLNGLYESENEYIFYKRDEYGLRSNCEDINEIDILTLGGSTTDQRYIKFESTYQYILQDKIIDYIEKDLCIANAGIDGHTTYGHIYSLNNWLPNIPNLKPKYIILYIGINDADFTRVGANIGFDINDNSSAKGLLKNLYIIQKLIPLIRYIRSNFLNNKKKYTNHFKFSFNQEDYNVDQININTKKLTEINTKLFEERLKVILKKIETFNSQHICITQPHLFVKNISDQKKGISSVINENYSGLDFDYSLNSLNNVMKNLCGKYYIEIKNEQFNKKHFYDGVHTNEQGSEFLGNLIYKEMKLRGFLEIFK